MSAKEYSLADEKDYFTRRFAGRQRRPADARGLRSPWAFGGAARPIGPGPSGADGGVSEQRQGSDAYKIGQICRPESILRS